MGESSDGSVAAMKMVEEVQNQPKIPPESIKLLEIMEKCEEDRLTALPDCLLIEILSRLRSTKDAIRTGTLSKRWKHLWTLLPTLIFQHYDDDTPWSDFVSFIDKTLNQCRQLKPKIFELYTSSYDIQFESQVNNWIRYAISCNVEKLTLCLFMPFEAEFQLDQFIYTSSCFTDLTLECCIISPTGEINWKNLRSLHMWYMNLDEDLIENILSGSPVLETLELASCYGYRRLDITSKSVKNLVFYGYHDTLDDREGVIVINAPYILSLTIHGLLFEWELLLLNVSSLVEANLDYKKHGHSWMTRKEEQEEQEEMLKGLIQSLGHVKELKIGEYCYQVVYRLGAKGFVFPSNMVKLPDNYSYESDSDW